LTRAGLLEGKVAVVTGAGQGLGLAIAQEFAAEGARVVIAELDEATGARAAAELRSGGAQAVHIRADVRDEQSVAAVVAGCLAEFGTIDVVVNNASIITTMTLRKMAVADWDQVVDVHLKGTWLMMREAAGPMRAQGHGSFVNISSIVAKTGGIGQGHYAAAKAGVIGLTKSAAKEWARDGVRVNAVQPGLFSTAKAQTMSDSAWQKRVGETPMGRAGEPRELATAVLFLASDLSSFVTGTVLEVTGGRDM
jgi:3-oxoacyl-[acyl-carrier protein] reductase